jgi:hypothetical protein
MKAWLKTGLTGRISWLVIASQSRARLSEAIHRRHSKKSWIASSQELLAMTVGRSSSQVSSLFKQPITIFQTVILSNCHSFKLSLRANGSRVRAPDDRLREAIQLWRRGEKAGLLRRKGSSQ